MLRVTLIRKFPKIDLSEKELGTLEDFVSWRRVPVFPRRGRLAWHLFGDPPKRRDDPSVQYQAAKIKGVGVYNPPEGLRGRDPVFKETLTEPRPPTTEPLSSFVTYPHLGFASDTSFMAAYGDVAPVGGITVDKALREYEAAEHLYAAGVPSIAPMLVFNYDDPALVFQGKQLGAVICGVPDSQPYRISEVQFGAGLGNSEGDQSEVYYRRLLSSFEIEGDPFAEVTRLTLLGQIARQVGERIAQFSRAGLYRYSAELPNFDFDFVRGQVLLTDLDSCDFLSELDHSFQRLQIMRDFASAVYHLIAKFATPRALGHYTVRALLENDPIPHLLDGYFGSDYAQDWTASSRKLWNCFLPHFELLSKYRNDIWDAWSQERRRTYKMDHHLFYVLVMSEFAEHFSRRTSSFPGTDMPEHRIDAMAQIFLERRYDYFRYLRFPY